MRRTGWWAAITLACWTPAGLYAQSVNMGPTFHELEGRAQRVVVAFGDAEVTTTREADGRWRAVLRDGRGRAHAELDGQRGHRTVRYRPASAPAGSHAFELAEATEVGLDWAALQLYTTWTDEQAMRVAGRVTDPGVAVWDGHVRRAPDAQGRGRSVAQLASRIRAVRTTFDEVDVEATLDHHTRVAVAGKRVDYSRFTARVRDRRSGRDLGFLRWFDTAQAVTWKIEGGGAGVILPERLREGWTFTPDMAWANVQAYYFATRPPHPADGPVAQQFRELFARPTDAPALGQVAYLGPFAQMSRVVPWRLPLPAWTAGGAVMNETGCDNLHWLDGSIFRACCDRHDMCYEKNGCSASSWWWPFSGSWQCARCNAQAAYCFCTLASPYHCGGSGGGGGGGSDSGGCERTSGGFCPIECQSCIAS